MNETTKMRIEYFTGILFALSITSSSYIGYLLGSKIETETYKDMFYPSPIHFNYEIKNPIDNSMIACNGTQMTAQDINYGVELQKRVIENNSYYRTKFKVDLIQVFSHAPRTLDKIKTKGIEATLNEAPIIEEINCKPKSEVK